MNKDKAGGMSKAGQGANLRFDVAGLYKRLQLCTAVPLRRALAGICIMNSAINQYFSGKYGFNNSLTTF